METDGQTDMAGQTHTETDGQTDGHGWTDGPTARRALDNARGRELLMDDFLHLIPAHCSQALFSE